jgi:hypothetical protein
MYNKKLLLTVLKDLNKAKKPTKKKDINYDATGKGMLNKNYAGKPVRLATDTLYNPTPYRINAKSDNGIEQTLEPYDETTVNFPGANYIDEYPEMKKGGGFSRNLLATNRLFKKNTLFKKNPLTKPNKLFKKKSYKRKTYDPMSMYFEDGGENKTKLNKKEEKEFQKFYNTLPENLQTDDNTYDIRGYWDALGRPQEFDYTQPTEADGYYHGFSINPNTGEYLKSPAHPTFQQAVEEDRKIGYRPIPNVYGRNIATYNESIADPEQQTFLRNTEGPANYIETELTPKEIDEYRKGGYIVEDISIPSLNKFAQGGEEDCPKGYMRSYNGKCVPSPISEQAADEEWYRNWYANRVIQDEEGQKLLDNARSKILKRAEKFPETTWYSEPGSSTYGSFEPLTGELRLNSDALDGNPFLKDEVKFHEKGHYLTSPNMLDPETDTVEEVVAHPIQHLRNYETNIVDQALKSRKDIPKEDRDHYDYMKGVGEAQPYTEEISKNLMQLRRLAGFKPDQVITEEDINNLYKKADEKGWTDPNSDFFVEPFLNLINYTKDTEQLKTLFNKLAKNEPEQVDDFQPQQAQYGGALSKFIGGGSPCDDGYTYDPKLGCIPLSEENMTEDQRWMVEWYKNRKIQFPEDQPSFKKVVEKVLPAYNPESPMLEQMQSFPVYETMPKEYMQEDIGGFPAAGMYDTSGKVPKIYFNPELTPEQKSDTERHELTNYLMEPVKDKLYPMYNKIVEENIIPFDENWPKEKQDFYDYVIDPEEQNIQSYLNVARKKFNLKADEVITPERLNQMRDEAEKKGMLDKDNKNFNQDIYLLFKMAKDDEGLMKWFNLIAKKDSNKDDIQYGKYGGSLHKFIEGGNKKGCPPGQYWNGKKCTKLITLKDDKKYIDGVANWAMHVSDPNIVSGNYNDQIKNRLYSGKWGLDPETGALVNLSAVQPKSVTTLDAKTKAAREKEKKEQTAQRIKWDSQDTYRQSIIDAGFDPATFGKAKGVNTITGEPIYASSKEEADRINQEAINQFAIEGHSAVVNNPVFKAGAYMTPVGMAIGAMEGLARFVPDAATFAQDPTLANAGQLGLDALQALPVVGKPLASATGKAFNYVKNLEPSPPGPLMLLGRTNSGGNMVKKNMNYYKQLLDSYDGKKMSFANRKFYNDLIETGKKQDGMVTEAQLNELNKLQNSNFDFGKRGYNKESLLQVEPKAPIEGGTPPPVKSGYSINLKGAFQRYPKGPLTEEEILSYKNSPEYQKFSQEHADLINKYGSDWTLPNYMDEHLNEAISTGNRSRVNPVLYGGRNWNATDYTIAGLVASAYPGAAAVVGTAFSPPPIKNKILKNAGITGVPGGLSSKDTLIDITNAPMDFAKVNETKDGKIIIGGEFIENANNSVRTAKDWLTANDTYSDKNYPSNKIESFYGIEDGKFKVGKANEFDSDTEIVPRRFGAKNIDKAIMNGDEMRLLDKNGDPIYQNTPNTGKFILYSPSTKKAEFAYITSGKKGVNLVNDFLKKNKDAQYIHLDNGRYEYYGLNPGGLTKQDFESYYHQDLGREGTPGYNLIIKEDGGSVNYQLGDEIDETTMNELKRLGYTFEEL